MPFTIPTTWTDIGDPNRVTSGEVVRSGATDFEHVRALLRNDRRIRANRLRCLYSDHNTTIAGTAGYTTTNLAGFDLLFDAISIRTSDEITSRVVIVTVGSNVRVRVTITLPGGGSIAGTLIHVGAAETTQTALFAAAPLATSTTFFLRIELQRDAAVTAEGYLSAIEIVEPDLLAGDL